MEFWSFRHCAYTDAHSYANTNSDTDSYAYSNSDTDSHAYSKPNWRVAE